MKQGHIKGRYLLIIQANSLHFAKQMYDTLQGKINFVQLAHI